MLPKKTMSSFTVQRFRVKSVGCCSKSPCEEDYLTETANKFATRSALRGYLNALLADCEFDTIYNDFPDNRPEVYIRDDGAALDRLISRGGISLQARDTCWCYDYIVISDDSEDSAFIPRTMHASLFPDVKDLIDNCDLAVIYHSPK